jgi:hypothetical protein
MMTYKEWILVAKNEWNGIAVDYFDPEGNQYNEPLCFPTIEEVKSVLTDSFNQSLNCS